MRTLLEPLVLFPTFLRSKLYELREERRIRSAFYHHREFQRADLELKRAYRDLSPYQLSRQFLEQKGLCDIHLYGETPLTTLYQIACQFGLCAQDHVFELGSGIGRGVIFLSHYVGCTVTGIEWNPMFVERMILRIQNAPTTRLQSTDIATDHFPKRSILGEKSRVICGDFLDAEMQEATVIYFYGTHATDATILQLIEKWKFLPQTTKIITVSYPLTDYDKKHFIVEKRLESSFPWGTAEVFWNRTKSDSTEVAICQGCSSRNRPRASPTP